MEHVLVINQDDINCLLDHAESCLPLEAVALLFGIVTDERIVVRTTELLDNSAKSRTTFEVNPVEQYNLLVESEKRGEEMVCVFHSHPAPPKPSSTDMRNMRLNPVVWLIASKTTGQWKYKAFLLDEHQDPKEIGIVSP